MIEFIGLNDVIHVDFLEPTFAALDWSEGGATNNIQETFSLSRLDASWTDGGVLYLDSRASFDREEVHEPSGLLVGLDLNAAWESAAALLRSHGEDVKGLLRQAGERVDAWRSLGGVQHLVSGPFVEDEVRKPRN